MNISTVPTAIYSLRGAVSLTQGLEGQCGEEYDQDGDEVLQGDHSQVAGHTGHLRANTL